MTGMNRLGKLTADLFEHPLMVSNAALRASMAVVKMHRDMKDVSQSMTAYQLDDAINSVRREEEQVYGNLAIIRRDILGEGVIGQVALDKRAILLANINRGDADARSGTIDEAPVSIYAMPLLYEDEIHGVIEVASFQAIEAIRKEYLDLSKIESGHLTLILSEFDPASVIQQSLTMVRPLGEEQGLTFDVSIDPLPTMYSDEDRVSQILINLLSNATKFTRDGGIEVSATATDDSITFIDALRDNSETDDLPVIVVTAKDLSSEERKRLAGSVEQTIPKGANEIIVRLTRKQASSINSLIW